MTERRPRGALLEFVLLAFVTSRSAVAGADQPVKAPPPRVVLRGHRNAVDAIRPSADGRLVVTASKKDGTVRIWDVATGTERRLIKQELVGNSIQIWDIVSPTERRLIAEELVDTDDPHGEPPSTRKKHPGGPGHTIASPRPILRGPLKIDAGLLPDRHHLVMVICDEEVSRRCPDEIVIYDMESGGHETIFSARANPLRKTQLANHAISSRYEVMADHEERWEPAAGGYQRSSVVRTYDVLARRFQAQLDAEGLSFTHIGLSPGGDLVSAVTHSDVFTPKKKVFSGLVTVWNARTGQKAGRIQTGGRVVYGSCFSPNGRELAVLGNLYCNTVFICYLQTWKIGWTLNEFRDKPGQGRLAIHHLAYTPDGKYLMAHGVNGTALFWETTEYREVLWVRLSQPGYVAAVFSPDGRKIMATGGGEGESDVINVWDTDQFLSLIPKAPARPGAATGVRRD